uniref:Uncharacterized protein n=1 Tax=Fagus sylvatica TaxID=28930 RepID=A0A2N9F9K0_FAGSY
MESGRDGLLESPKLRGTRPRPNRAHGTNAKSEEAHINTEEMLDAAEPRDGRAKVWGAEKMHDEAEVAFDRPWMCQGVLQA